MTRSVALPLLALLLGLGCGGPAGADQPGSASGNSYDILIAGGTIYPGDEAPFVGDLAIAGDRIVYLGPKAPGHAVRSIDAHGLVVAPGFIDPHTHVGDALASENPVARLVLPFLTQGVTTAFIGVDGGGSPEVAKVLGNPGGSASRRARDYGINFATYIGFGAVRAAVVGNSDRAPTPAELERMEGLVAKGMCQGALGLSTGLFYAPQSFASQGEVVALAQVAGDAGGIYDTHMRDESSYSIGLLGSIDETLRIGRAANIPVHIAHIKALGVDVQGMAPRVIATIEAARAIGQAVTADQYPWAASGTGLAAALIPRWAQDGGRAAMLQRFRDPATRARLMPEIGENLRRRGGAEALLITGGPDWAIGRSLADVAKGRNTDPIAAALELLAAADAEVASFNQSEADIAAFMQRDWVVTSSDASAGHPRYYASFARKYATYVRERGTLDLRNFIASSTARTARMFKLAARGELKPGFFADVIVFDPDRFAPRAGYAQPTLFSTGMRTVIVNGQIAIEGGEATGVASGRPLPHSPAGAACRP
ncbi:MAG: amidohydrolase family protein [Proteobacteria bacterium]|nr:amidohydrolase family protein [Pseudomonadota bacterium]